MTFFATPKSFEFANSTKFSEISYHGIQKLPRWLILDALDLDAEQAARLCAQAARSAAAGLSLCTEAHEFMN